MIGHLIRYHPAFIALLAQVKGGAIENSVYTGKQIAMGRIRIQNLRCLTCVRMIYL